MSETYIWITQYRQGDSHEVVQLAPSGSADSRRTFSQLERVFPQSVRQEPCTEGAVWIELVLDGDLQDTTISIAPSQGEWLLREFFRQPAKVVRKVKGVG